jgi:hypothetical protein
MKNDSIKLLVLIFIVGLFLFQTSLQAQQKELKVLFVGNSYTYGNNLPHIVAILSEGTDTKLFTRKSVIGGAHLREHWNGDRGLQTKEIIKEGDFDIVVLQDHSRVITGELPKEIPQSFRTLDSHGETLYLMHVDGLDAEFCRRVTEVIIP